MKVNPDCQSSHVIPEQLERLLNNHQRMVAVLQKVRQWREQINKENQLSNYDDKIWMMVDDVLIEVKP